MASPSKQLRINSPSMASRSERLLRVTNSLSIPSPSDPLRIGFALDRKKQEIFFTPSVVKSAKDRKMDLIKIDLDIPLIEQGPFYCVLQKLYGDDWKRKIADYQAKNPFTLIVDSPVAAAGLHNRISMLHSVSKLEIGEQADGILGIEQQLVLFDQKSLLDPLPFAFPVVVKPLVADGSADWHKMRIAYSLADLSTLRAPMVIQPIVLGVDVYKVYVAGGETSVVKGQWINDTPSVQGLATLRDSLKFSMIKGEEAFEVPLALINEVAGKLKDKFNLQLLSFYLIKEDKVGEGKPDRYLLLDLSYFPGYSKIEDEAYRNEMIGFFLSGMTIISSGVRVSAMTPLEATMEKKKIQEMQDTITRLDGW